MSNPPRAGSLAGIPAGRRTKWLMLVVWLILIVVFGSFAGRLQGAEKNDAAAWLPASAESTQVVKLEERFRPSDIALAVVVYERPAGITAADEAKAKADAVGFQRLPGVVDPVQGPFPAKDGKALQTLVPVTGEKVIDFTDPARDMVRRGPPGLAAHVTGPAGGAADSIKVFQSLDGFLLLAAGSVVIVLLLLIYRSPVLWLAPVITVVGSLSVAMGVVYLLAAHAGLTVNGQSGGILPVLVFGVGTDYALLMIARYREELHRHEDKHEAMAFALHRAGPAILASAATVAIGMLCLMAAELNSTVGLGPVAAVGVICALAAMTTLMPALLVTLPRAVFWPKVPRFDTAYVNPDAYDSEHGVWARVAKAVSARPRLIWAAVTIALIAMTFGLTSLHVSGLSNAGQFVAKPDSVVGESVVARHFPAGSGTPAVIIGDAAGAGPLRDAIAGTAGVAQVSAPGTVGAMVRYEAVLKVPADGKAARDTIDRLRTAVHPLHAKVGGQTAARLDIGRAASHDNKLIIPIVLVVVFLILIALLRSIVAPLLMMITVVLSFAASLGASGLVFGKLFGFEGVDQGFPLLAFIFLVALGVDYNIFLMTRVREESQVLGTRRGVLRGLTVTGGVITSAGLVLAATFAALVTLPLVGMVEMGFVVSFGVLLDTVVVRSLLLPALAFDLGRRIWAPGRLAREELEVEGPEPRVLQQVG
jgi:putative drug exporter of the RND superfamily